MLTSTSPLVRQLVLSLLALPPLFLTIYIIAGFPYPPHPSVIHSSLASLPPSCPSWSVYPEDYYQGGSYVTLPHGRVSLRSPISHYSNATHISTDKILAHWPNRRPAGSSSFHFPLYPPFLQPYLSGRPHPWPLNPGHCLEGRRASPRFPRFPGPPLW